MKCPFCGGETVHGEMVGDGRSAVIFRQEGRKIGFFERLSGVGRVSAKGGFYRFRIDGDYCDKCKKIILDAEVGK